MNEIGINEGATYPTTIWSEVRKAACTDSKDAIAVLGSLLQKYLTALQAHIEFKFNASREQAADWLQDFVCEKVLLGDLLKKASRDRGRFRTFLLNSLDNFVLSELRRARAQRRQPPGGLGYLEDSCLEIPGDSGKAVMERFNAAWAREMFGHVLGRMRAESEAKGCVARWEVFKACLLDPLLEGTRKPSYAELVDRLGFQSPAEAANALVTAKRQFDRLLRQVVGEYVGEGEEVENEIRELKQALLHDG